MCHKSHKKYGALFEIRKKIRENEFIGTVELNGIIRVRKEAAIRSSRNGNKMDCTETATKDPAIAHSLYALSGTITTTSIATVEPDVPNRLISLLPSSMTLQSLPLQQPRLRDPRARSQRSSDRAIERSSDRALHLAPGSRLFPLPFRRIV
jgi:hypothetical protein